MNDLYTDTGFYSLYKSGEQLCGDHVDIATAADGSRIAVLADGLGSGVKASILSTLTAKIISTMLAQGLSLDDCVKAMADTLPAAEDGVAYSTFTIIRVSDNSHAEIIQYDNPHVIFLCRGSRVEYTENARSIQGRTIYFSEAELECGDVLVAMSDGVIGASANNIMNPDWQRGNVTDFLEAVYHPDYTAKDICTLLLDECYSLYGGAPNDDVTACVVRICRREQVNLVFGPPASKADDERMMGLFFSKSGRHIVCGGTTAMIASRYLSRPVIPQNDDEPGSDIPPVSLIEGVDLVTEGAVTLGRVLEYADDYARDNANYFKWGNKKNGAARIARMLFETATDINFFVGRAVNEAHQDKDKDEEEGVSFRNKMQIAERLCERLEHMGKNIKVSYF